MSEEFGNVETATSEEILARRAKLAAEMQARADRKWRYVLYGSAKTPKQPAANRPAPEAETRRPQSSAG